MCTGTSWRACLASLIVPIVLQMACVDASVLSGKACDESGRCLNGYVCDPYKRTCVPPDELDGHSLDGDDGRPDGADQDACPMEAICEGDILASCDGAGVWQHMTCDLGCLQDAGPARCLRLSPSNLDEDKRDLLCMSTQSLDLDQDSSMNTDTGIIITRGQEAISPEVFELVSGQEDTPGLAVFAFDRFGVRAGVRVRVDGARALVILACRSIEIAGILDASGHEGHMGGDAVSVPGAGGPGAFRGGDKSGGDGLGPGASSGGAQAACDPSLDSGAGGGGHGGPGGGGGDGGDPEDCGVRGSSGGVSYGVPDLVPLMGGSGGGGGGDGSGGPGGGGGGAVQLAAGERIEIPAGGGVLAGGGGGAGGHDGEDSSAGGGGGSGGAILLEAAAIEIAGTLAANGGGGGAGYPDNTGWADQVAQDGTGGQLTAEPAPGGTSHDLGGTGGAGSGGDRAAGMDGQDRHNGGGGGGGAGRIRLNTASGQIETRDTAVISPSGRQGGCSDLCTQGIVSGW